MTADEFKPLMARVEAWWPGTKWDEAMIVVWFGDLRRFSVGEVRVALERLKRTHTAPFAPSIGALLGLLERPEQALTFEDAYELIYGRGGVLRARLVHDPPREIPPVVTSFVDRQGLSWLASLPVDDPQWGPRHRRDLEAAWGRHVEASAGREIAQLAAGGLRQLDPARALGGAA